MNQLNALDSLGNAYVHLDDRFASELRVFGVSPEVIESLRAALAVMSRDKDPMGYGYARFMRQALLEYSLDAMKEQTQFMLARMDFWTGEEADAHKTILRAFAAQR